LAFPDPMRKLVDSFGRIKPAGSATHLSIENQKGLTSEPLPLGVSVADGSGGETVTVAGLAEGTELSLGTALASGNWLVPVADLDRTFVGAPMSFVGVMTAKVTLNSATGKRLEARNIRFEWNTPEPYSAPPAGQTEPTRGPTPTTSGRAEPTPALGPVQSPPVPETAESFAAPLQPVPSPAAAPLAGRRKRGRNGPTAPTASDVGTSGQKPFSYAPTDTRLHAGSNKAQSPPCLASAAEVRKLMNAWPKWTYGPTGERCWYSSQKPFFSKEMPAQAEVIPAPLSYAPTDTRLHAGSNRAQSPPCLASAAEVRKLTPNAWPKWTYGPMGERCWYSGEKPIR
jgi:hypothetical protein